MKLRQIFFFLMLCLSIPQAAFAEWKPTKPIAWVVGFAAGGPTDLLARIIAPKLGEVLGTTVIVENRAGAAGNIAFTQAAQAKPDGYTIILGTTGNVVINPHMYTKSAVDTQKRFSFIAPLSKYSNVLIVNSSVPVKNVGELIAYAKQNPGKVTYGSGGNGASNHLAGVILEMATNAPLTHVPYKGSGPAMIDLMGGNITFMFDLLSTGLNNVSTGKIRPIAVTNSERSKFAPEIPTMKESGVPEYEKVSGELWVAVYGPAGMPPDVLETIRRGFTLALKSPEVRAKLDEQKYEEWNLKPEEYPEFYRGEYAKWGAAVKASGAKIE
ncbi:MAG: uncharacterized protein K0R53_2338 [Burkholderiales bacterium]|nr:uncharacterized protein [Burkholderiales bacterium]